VILITGRHELAELPQAKHQPASSASLSTGKRCSRRLAMR
jgi:hypothetical protein